MTVARATWVAIATALCLAVHGCTGAGAGAVELSWRLRPEPGAGVTTPFVYCDGASLPEVMVDAIRLDWSITDGAGVVEKGAKAWSCGSSRGATGFELPPGSALLTVTPVCASGADATINTYIGPAPIAREVTPGGVVSLGAVVLVVQTSSCDTLGACICQ
jgi:hypothetical protein